MNDSRDNAGMLSDRDIKQFWGRGIDIQAAEKGELAFNLDEQLQFGSIDLHFRHEYKKIRLFLRLYLELWPYACIITISGHRKQEVYPRPGGT